jgi:group I intron endonuclease
MVIIYKITNQLTSKCYIGWTSQRLEQRWDQHKKLAQKNIDNRPFYNAIRKYGTDVWNLEVVEILPNNEKFIISKFLNLTKTVIMPH